MAVFFVAAVEPGGARRGCRGIAGFRDLGLCVFELYVKVKGPLGMKCSTGVATPTLNPAHFQTRTDKIPESQPLATPDIIPYSPKNP